MQTAPAMGRLAEEIKGRLDTGQDSKSHAARQRLVRLTARLDAMVIWRDDIQRRIEHARELQERGALFAQEQDDLIDAVRSWRLTCARVVLNLDGRRAD